MTYTAIGASVVAKALKNPIPAENASFTYNIKRPFSVKEFNAQWVSLPIPTASEYVYDDDYFAFLRVGGYNPLVIERVIELPSSFPMTDLLLHTVHGFRNDTLQEMIDEGRLFITDYKDLSSLVSGSNPVQKYVYCPIGLFGVKKGGKTYHIIN